jgi:hypothetical protein
VSDTSKLEKQAIEISFQKWSLTEPQISNLLESEQATEAAYAIVDIYNSLHTLFEDSLQADSWIHRPNQYFDGKTALEVMLKGIEEIQSVQTYLKNQLYK